MAEEQRPWAHFENERDEEHFIPWMDRCPYCSQEGPIGYSGWIMSPEKQEEAKLEEPLQLDVFFCVECDTVLNMDEEQPQAKVAWLTKEQAEAKGMELISCEDGCDHD